MFKLFKKNRQAAEVDYDNLPIHIGIIMDGNGRWAKRRGLARSAGHAAGAKTFERIVEDAGNIGIKIVTVYALSTENWSRPKEEIDALMALMEDYLDNGLARLAGRDVKIVFSGDLTVFSDEMIRKINHIKDETANNKTLILNVALNYGGRAELVRAARLIAEEVKDGKTEISDINEEMIAEHLYTCGLADPDLIIRPSGEYRLSNFLMWQSAYSELWFSNCLWPDFKKEDLLKAIADYQHRSRRFGGVK